MSSQQVRKIAERLPWLMDRSEGPKVVREVLRAVDAIELEGGKVTAPRAKVEAKRK